MMVNSSSSTESLTLSFGISFYDLYTHEGLLKLDQKFLHYLKQKDVELYDKLKDARNNHASILPEHHSALILELSEPLEVFIAKLFYIEDEIHSSQAYHKDLSVIYECKKSFIRRQVCKNYSAKTDWSKFDHKDYHQKLTKVLGENFDQLSFAKQVRVWLSNKESNADNIEIATQYAAWAMFSKNGKAEYRDWILFHIPQKIDYENDDPYTSVGLEKYIDNESIIDIGYDNIELLRAKSDRLVYRDGFSLTDEGASLIKCLDQANYCIFCHKQSKDSCSKGLKPKQSKSSGIHEKMEKFQRDHQGELLPGCPLEEKISEMNFLKSRGLVVSPLATAVIDNPMVAGTGHRICNDCMKSCIYQKQEPVNIPQIESRVLKDVIELPWGFEIYSLLTRWNPLNISKKFVKPDTGCKVLVAGLGPAGFTLAHYLLNEGHTVVGIDGLKIEPLPEDISGIDKYGNRVPFSPIKNISTLLEDLDTRVQYGFGGVAEYGITVRWDKGFLKIIRLLLERRGNFKMYGGTRFGSQINYITAFEELGFDHIALATGAGKPNILNIPNSVSKGIRTASDFLMSLQLTGASKRDSLTNLQIRLPVAVIGGGLTAIDTATEVMAYYVRQVEKFADCYKSLGVVVDNAEIMENWSELDKETSEEFLAHAKLFFSEREKAKSENRKPDFANIIKSLGGVRVFYRKEIIKSPSYRLNKEEVSHAFKEGIEFIENASPIKVNNNSSGDLCSIVFDIQGAGQKEFPCKTALLAIGTNPNTIPAKENPEVFMLDGKYFQAFDCNGNKVILERSVKPQINNIFASIDTRSGRAVSFFGDLHPSYQGNVVKAMASAKNGYEAISSIVKKNVINRNDAARGVVTKPDIKQSFHIRNKFFAHMNELLIPRVHRIDELTPNIIEIIIKAPLATKKFQPGQFYRLQNYAVLSPKLPMEGVALTGALVDKDKGLISLIVLEMGGASSICRFLQPDEPVVLMGPTGHPTEIKSGENVLLIGGGLGNAVLFSIGKAFRDAGSKVLYFAGYKHKTDRYKEAEIEKAADQIVWCCDEGKLSTSRKEDISCHANMVEALSKYSMRELGGEMFDFANVNRIIAIGSSGMMNAVNEVRKKSLCKKLPENHQAIASINSPMQCMMKEICAQCLQKQVDPHTGIETYVYSCTNQDQDMNVVDFKHLDDRLSQNSLLEKISAKWLNKIKLKL